jgi:hypothetical protein
MPWLRRAALGDAAAGRCAGADLVEEDEERWFLTEKPAGLLLEEVEAG